MESYHYPYNHCFKNQQTNMQNKTTISPMRSLKNRDLEGTNIKVVTSNGENYYYYIMPNGNRESLGKNRQDAIEAANILNQHLRGSGDLANTILKKQQNLQVGKPIEEIIDGFIKNWIPEQSYSRQTLAGKLQKLNIYKQHFKNRSIKTINTKAIAEFLKPYQPNPYMKHRI